MEKIDVCKKIGECMGRFFIEDGKYCIETPKPKTFKYDTPDELLADWVDVLRELDAAKNEDTWKAEIEFIEKEVLAH